MCLSREGLVRLIKYIYNQMYFLQECGDFTWRVSDCEELVGVTQTSKNHPLNSLKPLSKRILLNEFESSERQN